MSKFHYGNYENSRFFGVRIQNQFKIRNGMVDPPSLMLIINVIISFQRVLNPENGWYDPEKDTIILEAEFNVELPRDIK